jgi:DNA primase
MRFSNSFLDELRDRVSISDVIGRRVTWDRKKTNTGRGDYWACCPFHGEKSPSFHCEDRKGRYHCFGCGVSGDHFRFLMELDGMAFNEAVQQVADIAGVPLPQPDPESERRERERHNLHDVMELATTFFQDQLQSAAGAKARAYLRDRGLTGRTIETFRLGFAVDSRNALKEFLSSKGVAKDQIEACGLVVHGPEIPVSYDRFRDRIMFPILSSREKVIAFGGRAMSPDAPAKYLNSNETELFSKGQVLFNFSRARKSLQGGEGTIIVVEGYMDVIALHQAGVENAVAPLGTALTENQLALLWKMTPVPVLCFDGDGAGMRAASRAVDLALPVVKPGFSLKVALLPEGKDPDDIVKIEGRAPFDRVISDARALAEMVWLRETSGTVFETPEKRAELEAKLKTVTQVIADESVRRHYQQDMRDRLYAFFQASSQKGQQARQPFVPRGQQQGGQRDQKATGKGRMAPISDRLAKSGLVAGYRGLPSLRESVLALTIVNHPALFFEDYDEINQIEYQNRDMQRFWQAVMSVAAASGPGLTREDLINALDVQGFDAFLTSLDRQIRFARLWTATEEAAIEDAREGYRQALALQTRARAVIRHRHELEREIADAIERGAEDEVERMMLALNENQLEGVRLESQEALIDGFGVMSGRVKGPAGGGH